MQGQIKKEIYVMQCEACGHRGVCAHVILAESLVRRIGMETPVLLTRQPTFSVVVSSCEDFALHIDVTGGER